MSAIKNTLRTKTIYMKKMKIILFLTLLMIGLFHQPVKSKIVDWDWHKPMNSLFWEQDMYKKTLKDASIIFIIMKI